MPRDGTNLENLRVIAVALGDLCERVVLENAAPALRAAVRNAFSKLLDHPDFLNGLSGLVADPERAGIVADRLRQMCA